MREHPALKKMSFIFFWGGGGWVAIWSSGLDPDSEPPDPLTQLHPDQQHWGKTATSTVVWILNERKTLGNFRITLYLTEDGGVLVRCVGRVLFPAPDVDKEPLEPVPVEVVTSLHGSKHFQIAVVF
jgi:hypothetical protein